MATIKNVIIKDATTLILKEPANIDDEINLLDLNKIDTSIILKKIEESNDAVYSKKLEEMKQMFELESSQKSTEEKLVLEKEIIVLKEKLDTLKTQTEQELTLKYTDEISELKNTLSNQLLENSNLIAQLKLQHDLEISKLNEQLSKKTSEFNNELKINLLEQAEKYKEEIIIKDKEIEKLNYAKSYFNIKRIGENLEHWCDNEYTRYAQVGFSTCTWEKDNKVVKNDDESKGSKADFIFNVFASNDYTPENLLTSVVCEMKSEDPMSVNKKKNADHYKKLESDRIKKGCEYSLLVSELELDQPNDVPIKKVLEYDKMYVVRPQYFVTFLSIIQLMALKYKETLINSNVEREKFKDSTLILEEFESMKTRLLDKPIIALEKEIGVIVKNAEAIRESAKKILDSTDKLTNDTIRSIKDKIENFKITKITKKIERIE